MNKKPFIKISFSLSAAISATVLLLILLLAYTDKLLGQTAGPNYTTLGVDIAGGGTAWATPTKIYAADGACATVSLSASGTSHNLKATNFGFTIPAVATITGITVNINEYTSAPAHIVDNIIRLVKGGTITGNNNSAGSLWSTTQNTVSYGGSSDLWGTTWLPADINAANFGVVLSVTDNNAGGAVRVASVDYITISVSYTVPCSGTPAPGNTISSANPVCPSSGFTLSLQNATSGTGVTYQWYSSTTGSAPWTSIVGATSSTYAASETVSTYYYCAVTCSGNTGNSTALLVNVSSLPSCTAPAVTPVSYCQNATATALSVTGTAGSGTISSYAWYSSPNSDGSGSTLVATHPSSLATDAYSPVTTVIGALYYYAIITNSNTCTATGGVSNAVTITGASTITLGANPTTGTGATSANLPYTATTGSPDEYSIVWSPAAHTAGFVDVNNASLLSGIIALPVASAAAAGTYTGTLTVANASAGCVSAGYAISVTLVNCRYSVASGNWNATSTWALTSGGIAGASFPVAGMMVCIENGYTVTVNVASACASINFTGLGSPATLTVSSGITLTMTGSITVSSLAAADNSSTINGSGTINGGTTIIVGSSIDPTGGTNSTTLNSSISTLNISSSITLYSFCNGTNYNNPVFNLSAGTFTPTGGVITSNADASNIATFSMVTGAQTGTLVLNGATTFTLSGTGINNFTLSGANATVQYNSSGAQTILAAIYNNLTCNGLGGNKTFANGCTVNGTFSVSGGNTVIMNTSNVAPAKVFYINILSLTGGGTINTSTGTLLGVATILNISGSFTQASGTTFSFTGSGYGRLLFTGGGTTYYTNAYTNQTTNYYAYDIQVSNNTTLILNTDLGLNQVVSTAMLTIDVGSTLITGTHQLWANIAGQTWIINGTLKTANTAGLDGSTSTTLVSTNSPAITIASTSTIEYNGTALQHVTAHSNYGNFTINNTSGSACILDGVSSVSGVLYMENGILTTTGTKTLSVTNTATNAMQGGSTTSFVNGPLTWSLPTLSGSSSVYTWLVGCGTTYLPFALTSLTTTTPVITVQATNTSSPSAADGTTLTSLGTEFWNATVNSGTYTDGQISLLTRQSTIGTLNVIGQSSAQPGTYVNIGGSVSGSYSIINSGFTGNTLGYFAMAVQNACSTPGTQVSSIVFSGVTPVQMTVGLTKGNGSKRIVIMNTSNSFTNPTNGVDPSANPVYGGSGQQVVYNGTGTGASVVTVTNLSPSTTYYFEAFEANCAGTSVVYNTTSPPSGSKATSAITYYYNNSSRLDLPANWGTTTAGGGTHPTDFTGIWCYYVIINNTPANIQAAWSISATGSKVILGNASYPAVTFNIPSTSAFTGTIDIAAASSGSNTLTLGNSTVPTLGSLDPTSTVNYSYAGTQAVTATTYGNLIFSGTGSKTFSGGCTIGTLTVNNTNTVFLNNTTTLRNFTVNTLSLGGGGTIDAGNSNPAAAQVTTNLYVTNSYTQTTTSTFTGSAANAYCILIFSGGGSTTYTNAYATTSANFSNTQVEISNNTTLTLNSDLAPSSTMSAANIVTIDMGSTLIAGNYKIVADITLRSVQINGTLQTTNSLGLDGYAGSTISNSSDPYITLGTSSTIMYNSTSSTQIITAHTDYANLTINNTSGIDCTLGGNSIMAGILTMTSGNVNLSGNSLTIGTGPVTPGSVSYTAGWMYGGNLVRYFVNNTTIADRNVASGLFPIGSSTNYRPVYVSCPSFASSTNGTITLSHTNVTGTTSVNFSDNGFQVLIRRNAYWTLAFASLTGGTYDLSAEGTGFGTISNVVDLRLIRFNNAVGTPGTNAGTLTDPQINRTGISLANLANNYYIGSTSTSDLPIELSSFNAACRDNKVSLNWVTASETNNDYFTIERSRDLVNYEKVTTVPGAGNSNSLHTYSYIDDNANEGNLYYRLKQTDYNGTTVAFDPAAVKCNEGSAEISISFYPNPFNSELIISTKNIPNKISSIMIYDMMGKKVYATNLTLANETGILSLNIDNNISKGIYLIKFISDGYTNTSRIVKE